MPRPRCLLASLASGVLMLLSLCKAAQVSGSAVRLLRSQATKRPSGIGSRCSQTAPAHLPQPDPVRRGATAPARGPAASPLLAAALHEPSCPSSFLQTSFAIKQKLPNRGVLAPRQPPLQLGCFKALAVFPFASPKLLCWNFSTFSLASVSPAPLTLLQ